KLAIFLGHENGAKQIEPIVEYAKNIGIQYMTFWAFSTENWKRSKEEIEVLMQISRKMIHSPTIERLKKNKVRCLVIGEITHFPEDIQRDIKELVNETKDNDSITVTIALNYGGRGEILRAVRKIIEDD